MESLLEDDFHREYYKCKKPSGISKTYYVVFRGREIGIYDDWKDVEAKVNGYSKSSHKSYQSFGEAERALKIHISRTNSTQK